MGPRPVAALRGHLQVNGLGHQRTGCAPLRAISFEAEPGASVVITGARGDEPTTLFSLLLGLRTPSAGSIILDGAELADLSISETRRRMAVVPADPWLLDGTITENIRFGRPAISDEQVGIAAALAGLDRAGAEVADLDTPVGADGAELGPATRRQVVLARALATEPGILLLDEPLAGLDHEARAVMIAALNRATEGRTTLVATRNHEIARNADAVYRIEEGRLMTVTTDQLPIFFGDDGDPGADDSGTGAAANWRTDEGRAGTTAPAASGSPAADRDSRRGRRRRDGARSASVDVGLEIAEGYRAAGLIDRGPHTETWLAWSRRLADAVTVRIPRRQPVTYTAFEEISREFTIACGLGHAGIAAALDADLETDLPYVVHERVPGRTLASAIAQRDEPLRASEVLSIAYDLAHALDHLHRRGFAHLDLRPETVVRAGPRGAVITDLRHALPLGEQRVRFIERHRHGLVAPELLRGAAASGAMDVHALGMVLHQCLTGQLVDDHDPEGWELLALDERGFRHRRSISELAPGTDPEVLRLVEWLLADDPADRPSTTEVLGRLRPMLLQVLPGLSRAA